MTSAPAADADPASISLFISFTALDWSRLPRCRDPWTRPIGTLLPVAGPGITVVAKPAESLGLAVIVDGPGALGATPGLKMGGGGVCGTRITPGFTPLSGVAQRAPTHGCGQNS